MPSYSLNDNPRLDAAIARTALRAPGSVSRDRDGLLLTVERYQREGSAGTPAVHGGIFYVLSEQPGASSRHRDVWYGVAGIERVVGKTFVKQPFVVSAPAGHGTLDVLNQFYGRPNTVKLAVAATRLATSNGGSQALDGLVATYQEMGIDVRLIEQVLQWTAPFSPSERRAVRRSAFVDVAAADTLRRNNYDSMLSLWDREYGLPGDSPPVAAHLQELFDVREAAVPGPDGRYWLHPHYLQYLPPDRRVPEEPAGDVRIWPAWRLAGRSASGHLAYPLDVKYEVPGGEPMRDDLEHELWEALMVMRAQDIEDMKSQGLQPPPLKQS